MCMVGARYIVCGGCGKQNRVWGCGGVNGGARLGERAGAEAGPYEGVRCTDEGARLGERAGAVAGP